MHQPFPPFPLCCVGREHTGLLAASSIAFPPMPGSVLAWTMQQSSPSRSPSTGPHGAGAASGCSYFRSRNRFWLFGEGLVKKSGVMLIGVDALWAAPGSPGS